MYKILKNFIDIDKYCLQRLSLPTSNTASGTNFYLENTIENPLKINLKASESTQDGEPTPESPQDIHVVKGDNKIDIINKNFINKEWEQKSFNFNNGFLPDYTDANIIRSGPYAIKPNTSYTFSCNEALGEMAVFYYEQDGTTVVAGTRYQGSNNYWTFTTPNNAYYVYIRIGSSSYPKSVANDYKQQLEKGNQPTPYVEHQEQNYPLTLGALELCKIGDYQDLIFKNTPESEYYDSTLENGKYYKLSKIGKIVLDGSENWYATNRIDGTTKFFLLNLSEQQRTSVKATQTTSGELCNNFIQNNPYTEIGNYFWIYDNNTLSVVRIGFDNQNMTTANELKEWLQTHNTIIYYPLATPTKTPLSDTLQEELNNIEENAKTYHGITNINQVNDDNSFILDIEYITQNLEV